MPRRYSKCAQGDQTIGDKTFKVPVGDRILSVSNLDRIVYPGSTSAEALTKAQVIEYYVRIAPVLTRYIKGRGISFVRYPDGINGEAFFQKNRPEYAPDWIEDIEIGDTKYLLLQEDAAIVWAANQNCLELHYGAGRTPTPEQSDYIVFDIDPPSDWPFMRLQNLVLELRDWVQGFGYTVFIKWSGRKGFHLVSPLVGAAADRVFGAAWELAEGFVQGREQYATLSISKRDRRERVLIDVHRNAQRQTIIAPYSLRGLAGAPVSAPLRWGEFEALKALPDLTLRDLPDRLVRAGDPWEGIGAYAGSLHSDLILNVVPKAMPSPDLSVYAKKRDFEITSEPLAEQAPVQSDHRFVLQRHRASRLHYDLRLELDGALLSWAVPKGLPPRPGVKRFAVQVEDHPVEYLTFEGTIPAGEYGGGVVDILASGRYVTTKEKKDGRYVRLSASGVDAEFRLIHTGGKEWLLERLDVPPEDWLSVIVDPMLAIAQSQPPVTVEYQYEVKWDGIRAIITIEDRCIVIRTRTGNDITEKFPEVQATDFEAANAIFDAELVCLDPEGRPDFGAITSRFHAKDGYERLASRQPAVCYVFDCLYLDGVPLLARPLRERRQWLERVTLADGHVRFSQSVADGSGLHRAAEALGLEGIMAKRLDSPYTIGSRSDDWIKIKFSQTTDCWIEGYVAKNGGIKSVVLTEGESEEGRRYVGRTIAGALEAQILAMSTTEEVPRLTGLDRRTAAQVIWLAAPLPIVVRFASRTKRGILREAQVSSTR